MCRDIKGECRNVVARRYRLYIELSTTLEALIVRASTVSEYVIAGSYVRLQLSEIRLGIILRT